MTEIKEKKEKKLLGGSKYAGAKSKRKVKVIKKDPKISKRNSDLKVKIKNLQKEIERIENASNPDQQEIARLKLKVENLTKVNIKVRKVKTALDKKINVKD